MINMATKPKDIKDWEKIEIERSSSEAVHTNVADLRADKHQVARYLNPPADTCYPLEYAYHLLGEVQGRSVVDFGCGSGENSLLLAQRKAKVYAMHLRVVDSCGAAAFGVEWNHFGRRIFRCFRL